MFTSKVISVRLDDDLVTQLNERAKKLRWYKRNTIIETVVWNCLNRMSEEDLLRMLRASHSRFENLKVKFVDEENPNT